MRFIQDDAFFQYERVQQAESGINLYILTRFNVSLPGAREKGGFSDDQKFREWCINRCDIFVKTCLPSIVSQRRRPDAWIILFDPRFERETSKALSAISKYPWIKPVFVPENFIGIRQEFNQAISRMIDPSKKFTATVRLDNDDALSSLYCPAIYQYLGGSMLETLKNDFWISFPYGVQWDGEEATLLIQNNNPFLTLVEQTSKFEDLRARTAMSINHGHIFQHGEVRIATARFPMWLQYVHGQNVSNAKNNTLWTFANKPQVLKLFSLK